MNNQPLQAINPPIVINLSDLYLYYSYDPVNYPAWLKGTESNRFYVGSYFCEKYFLKSVMRARNEIFRFALEQHCGITLVVPLPSDRWAARMKEILREVILQEPSIEEVVVNDFATLSFLEELRITSGHSFHITAGRLFFKNYRDPRYEEQQQGKTISFFPQTLLGKVDAAELDICSVEMDVTSIPEKIELHFHYPFTYVTCTHYCEFSSGGLPDTEKFRTGTRCGLKCMESVIRTDADGAVLLHLGKAVYSQSPNTLNASRQADRYIYCPINEFLAMEGRMQ